MVNSIITTIENFFSDLSAAQIGGVAGGGLVLILFILLVAAEDEKRDK